MCDQTALMLTQDLLSPYNADNHQGICWACTDTRDTPHLHPGHSRTESQCSHADTWTIQQITKVLIKRKIFKTFNPFNTSAAYWRRQKHALNA